MKRYTVTGDQPVLGDKMPGETFDAVLPEDQERFLVGINAIKVISTDVAADKRIHSPKSKKASPETEG